MALFQVDGWNLKQEKVVVGGTENKVKKKKNQKRARDTKSEVNASIEAEENLDTSETKRAKVKQDDGNKEKSKKKGKTSGSEENVETKITDKKKDITNKNSSTKSEGSAPSTFGSSLISTQKLTPLQQKMMAKLSGSRFRWINEQLYTSSSESALKLIKEQPQLFDEYHDGFRSQVQSWPENPVDVFVDQIRYRAKSRMVNAPGGLPGLYPSKKVVIADMGCGEAMLALKTNQFIEKFNKKVSPKKKINMEIHSFDLKKANDRITVADIKNVPLEDNSCTIVIFCLALMGTNFLDFINEAYRILAPRGELWIAEIKSRFEENDDHVGDEFVETLKLLGFFHKKTDNENKMFTRFEFFKPPPEIIQERKEKLERRKKFVEAESEKERLEEKRQKKAEGEWLLKPCIYKRR